MIVIAVVKCCVRLVTVADSEVESATTHASLLRPEAAETTSLRTGAILHN